MPWLMKAGMSRNVAFRFVSPQLCARASQSGVALFFETRRCLVWQSAHVAKVGGWLYRGVRLNCQGPHCRCAVASERVSYCWTLNSLKMGSLFRSEDMSLLRLYFERSAAHDTVDELGKLDVVQFSDLNDGVAAFQRSFSGNVRLCEDMQRRIRFLRAQIAADPALDEAATAAVGSIDTKAPAFREAADMIRLDDLDAELSKLERSFLQMNDNWDSLRSQENQLIELRHVLRYGILFYSTAPRVGTSNYGSLGLLSPNSPGSPLNSVFGLGGGANISLGSSTGAAPILEEDVEGNEIRPSLREGGSSASSSSLLKYIAGVVQSSKVQVFERVLYRATRGNCHARFANIPDALIDPATGESVDKTVFMLFFSGTEVKAKVTKICQAFDATRYPFPETSDQQRASSMQCEDRLADLRTIIETTAQSRAASLNEISRMLPVWADKVIREKSIYHTLNLLNYDTSSALFIAEVWAPSYALNDVNKALSIGRRRSQAQVSSIVESRAITKDVTPPTYFKVNRFTRVFQGIVESYGVAEYHEVNPAPFTVITFPFLFAVMFGDVGHGILMALFAAFIVVNEKRMVRQKLGEFLQTCYDGRYMLLLMGLFSVFTGLVYNEFFAVPLNLFGSRWKFTSASSMACGVDNCAVPSEVRAPKAPYPLGFDPVWKGSKNGLIFFNSYKMKLSIVLGVAQMVMGIALSYENARFHRKPLDIWYVFVPQMIFMNAIFGYLVVLILLKWSINWDSVSCRSDPTCVPPDLKTVLIDMFMSPGTLSKTGQLYWGQSLVQLVLLLLAVIAVPWMLLPKPLILKKKHDRKAKDSYRPLMDDGESAELLGANGGPSGSPAKNGPSVAGDFENSHADAEDVDEDFNFAEVFVNQMIHTIEFVLGAVSNTASYLRLWALSLAHAELSDVFLDKLLYTTVASGNPVLIVIGFFMWIGLTLGVLMFMESLSAFLHALRLHWVEFQNKFYNLHGDGMKFTPLSFNFDIAEEIKSK